MSSMSRFSLSEMKDKSNEISSVHQEITACMQSPDNDVDIEKVEHFTMFWES